MFSLQQQYMKNNLFHKFSMTSKNTNAKTSKTTQSKKEPLQTLNLNRILQLTQENQTCRIDDDPQPIIKPQNNKNSFFRGIDCVRRMCSFFFNRNKATQLDINQSQMSYMIDKIKNKKNGYQIVLPPLKQPKKTLVLDLDETLVFTTFKKPQFYDFEIEIQNKGKIAKAYTIKRFGVDSFLFQMSQIYEIVIFTASQRKYGEKIVASLDPKGWISHKLYRQHTIVVNKTYFLKNLKILGRNIKDIIMVDDNRMGGILQPDNFYRIQPFIGNQKDRKLFRLATFLKHINNFQDVRPISGYRKKYEQMQIKLKENNSETSTVDSCETKRKKYKHKKRNSEVQSLVHTQNTQENMEHENTANCLIIR